MRRLLPPRYWIHLGLSLLIASALVVPMVLAGVEARKRQTVLHGLDSRNPDVRERALNTLIRKAPDDIKLRTRVASHLPELPSATVFEVYRAVSYAEAAETPELRHAWLRELGRLDLSHLIAIGHQLPVDGVAERQAVVKAALPHLDTVDSGEDYDRLIALLDAYRGWACPPVPVHHYVQWLDRWVTSEDAEIRRAAAIQLGDLPKGHGAIHPAHVHDRLRSLLKDPEPQVREMALVATAGLVPHHPSTYLPDIESSLQDSMPSIANFARRLLAVWARSLSDVHDEPAVPIQLEPLSIGDWNKPELLLALEAAASASMELAFDPAMPHLVRIAATRASRDANPEWLLDTLRLNDRSAVRDLACVVLADRFTDEEIRIMTAQLLNDHDPDARASGAILTGLTGQGLDVLNEAEQQETRATTEYLMRLGQWMQNQRPELDAKVQGMLRRKAIPESTVMLAMLHRGQRQDVMDHLLSFGSPLADFEADDHTSLYWVWQERWHQILHRYLPEDAPLPRSDAKPDEVVEHFADLRAWHALFRHGGHTFPQSVGEAAR
ncbi:MAG: hypothetical protein AAGA25_04715 [Planctomycetota bacterium]